MIVIHIGLRKSGSASIQSFLTANEGLLRRAGVEYPRIGRVRRTGHLNLASELRGRRNFDPTYGALAQLADHWRQSSAKTLVISSEMFEDCEVAEAARLKDILRRGDEPFRIVLIVRDLADLMASSYAQKIKYGANIYDFDAFFDKRIGQKRVDYFQTAKRWAEVFGWESLRVRVLDSRRAGSGDLNDDFMGAAGIDLGDKEARDLSRPGLVNAAPGWRVLEAVRALYGGCHGLTADHPLAAAARHTKEQRRLVGLRSAQVGEGLGWNADKGRYLTAGQAARCLGIYQGAVEALNGHLSEKLPAPPGLEARGLAGRDFLPGAEHIARGELQAFYDEVGRIDLEAEARAGAGEGAA